MTENSKNPRIRFKGFTEAWEQRKLEKESSYIIAGGDVDKFLLKDIGQYPVIANALTNDGIVGYYESEYRIQAPALTITGRGDIGHAQARKTNFTPVVRLLTVKTSHNVDFLENAVNRKGFIVEASGVPQLTVPKVAELELKFPIQTTEEFKIGELFVNLDNLITLHQRE